MRTNLAPAATVRVDAIDLQIPRLLQQDALLSSAQVADRVGVFASPCWRRIQRLERDGSSRRCLEEG